VDGNVARVLARLFGVEGATGDAAREKHLWELAEVLVEGERPGDWNQALMELGATVCRPEGPTCLLCPLRSHCVALASGRVAEIPAPKAAVPRRALHLAVAAARRGDEVLLVRRDGTGLFGGLWELPGVECTPGSELDALRARWPKITARPLGRVERTLTHRALTIEIFAVEHLPPPDGARWATEEEAESLGISAAMQAVLGCVLGDRGGGGGTGGRAHARVDRGDDRTGRAPRASRPRRPGSGTPR
jgi:A/G-specific adenine glycosylase